MKVFDLVLYPYFISISVNQSCTSSEKLPFISFKSCYLSSIGVSFSFTVMIPISSSCTVLSVTSGISAFSVSVCSAFFLVAV
jgi:hypothetical protein